MLSVSAQAFGSPGLARTSTKPGQLRSRRGWLAILCLVLSGAADIAGAASLRVQAERRIGSEAAHIETEMRLPYPSGLVCTVMTDYDHMASFVPDLSTSRLLESSPEKRVVEWRGNAGFLFFKFPVTVVLDIERREDGIHVQSRSGNLAYEGLTKFSRLGQQVLVTQNLQITPTFTVPMLIGPSLIARQIRRQLEGLIVEMDRRAEHWDPRQTDEWCRFNPDAPQPTKPSVAP
ncbi:SRPBCC family protein [Thermithiobacillus plumbiphilus]|uniref:SRPBCC family protein n=1 Tax=Thermithiobacillus plumbiphilus TaxID=1729899 RepID=A0ABU9D9L5_9PROT